MSLLADFVTGAGSGAMMGAMIGGVLSIGMYFYALGNQRKGKAMGKGHTERLVWTGDYRIGLNLAREVLEATGGAFLSEDPNAGLILGRTKQSITSFGSTVRIQFHGPVGAINIDITVAPSASLYDMRQSKGYLDRYTAEWHRRMAVPPSVYPRHAATP
jgi:hypothetical protein